MAAKATIKLALLFLSPLAAVAHDPVKIKRAHHEHALYARQSSSTSSSSSAKGSSSSSASATSSGTISSASASVSGSISGSAPPSTLTATNPAIPPLSAIVSGMPTSVPPPFTPTFSPGAQAPISGAPPLPTGFDRSKYPAPTALAPVDSPEVSQWLKELDGIQIPDIPLTTNEAICSSNAEAAADTTRCWWTCGGCTRDTDVTTCPHKGDWGVSFDDGPSPNTPLLLDYLKQQNFHATFYAVGSSVYWLPQVLQAEYEAGHQIAVHTWFHQHLTTLSNEQIVAELGWSRQIIKDVLGVTPTRMRPPYGDIDDRVRAISLGMGLQPEIWTRDPKTMAQFDTNDWQIPAGAVTGPQSYQQFQAILANATDLNTGFIVLEHDLYPQTVDLAIGYNLPSAQAHQPPFSLKSIQECLGLAPGEVYHETATNQSSLSLHTNWTGNFLTGLQDATGVSSDNSTSKGGNNAGGQQGNGASRTELGAGAVLGLALAAFAALLA